MKKLANFNTSMASYLSFFLPSSHIITNQGMPCCKGVATTQIRYLIFEYDVNLAPLVNGVTRKLFIPNSKVIFGAYLAGCYLLSVHSCHTFPSITT